MCDQAEVTRLREAIATHRMEVEKANTRWPDAGVESPPQVITADINLWRRGGAERGRIWENDRDRLRVALERIAAMADRSDAHPDVDMGAVAREALASVSSSSRDSSNERTSEGAGQE